MPMRDGVFIEMSAYSVPFGREEIESFLVLFPDEALRQGMIKAAEEEQFEIAHLYKEELTRRENI